MVLFIFRAVVSLRSWRSLPRAVFHWLRNALPQETLRDETKTAARKTIGSGIGGQVLLFSGGGANKVPALNNPACYKDYSVVKLK